MKYRIVSLLGLLLALLWSNDALAKNDTTFVATAEEYHAALINQNVKYIALTADIDLAGLSNPAEDYHPYVWDKDISGLKRKYVKGKEYPYYAIKNQGYSFDDTYRMKMQYLVFEGCTSNIHSKTTNCTFNELIFKDCKESVSCGCLLSEYDYHSSMSNILMINCSAYDGGSYAGLICDEKHGGTMKNCVVQANCAVYAQKGKVGGLVGYADGVKIQNCVCMGTVLSYGDHSGGLAGEAGTCEISNCAFTGVVKQVDLSEDSFVEMLDKYIALNGWAIKAFNGYKIASQGYDAITLFSTFKDIENLYFVATEAITDLDQAMTIASSGFSNTIISGIVGCFVSDVSTFVLLSSTLELAWAVYGLYCLGSTTVDIIKNISAPDNVGGIVGCAWGGTIKRCANYGQVYGLDANCGGIAGKTTESYTTACSVIDCLNHGVVRGGDKVGGIIGHAAGNTNLYTNLNLGTIACSSDNVGRIIGYGRMASTMLYNCYSDSVSDLSSTEKKELRVSQKDLVSGNATRFLNTKSKAINKSGNAWYQQVGKTYWPNLDPTKSYVVAASGSTNGVDESLSTTLQVADQYSLTWALANPYSDINITGDIDFESNPHFNYCSKYMPFCGKIEGNGHTISNVSYEQTGKTFTFFGLETMWTAIGRVGFFGSAENATFRNMILKNFTLDMQTNVNNVSLFCAHSRNCVFDNIHITGNSAITESDGGEHYEEIVGGLIGGSENDRIINCSIGPSCSIYSSGSTSGLGDDDKSLTGGLVGWAKGSTFSKCANYGTVKIGGPNYFVGGIVGKAENGSMDRCLNTGTVIACAYTGGIAGSGENMSVTRCVNTGSLEFCGWGFSSDMDLFFNQYRAGGIVGELNGSSSSIDYCMNFGTMKDMGRGCNYISSKSGTGNYYYCTFNGSHKDNISSFSDSYHTNAAMTSGAAAMNLKDGDGNRWLYQDIDKNVFYTHYPVPIDTAGIVYSNILCDGTQSYSNKYNSTCAHASVAGGLGLCNTCGKMIGRAAEADNTITISSALELVNFANSLNSGTDFSKCTIKLGCDIDLKGCDFPIIGTSASRPFIGTFDGQGHRIKNMVLAKSKDGVGLFGYVGGTSPTIKNLIIDSSCSVSSSGLYVAGLVGCVVKSTSGTVTIENCGNEGTVYASMYNAGLVGYVQQGFGGRVNVINCYNTGYIHGKGHTSKWSRETAAIVGMSYGTLYTKNTWNSGNVELDSDYKKTLGDSFFCNPTMSYTGHTIYSDNCYTTITGDYALTANYITEDMVSNGELCDLLNSKSTVFSQNVSTDTHPVPGTAGTTGVTRVYIRTPKELLDFANSVNNGYEDYGTGLVYLQNDLDLSGVEYTPIGTVSHPFNGTFNGKGHRIKNLSLTRSSGGGVGFFGVVGGAQACIKNLIIDKSCSITSTGKHSGTAGLVGFVQTPLYTINKILIYNCGNEATITGYDNVAGILGGVYENVSTNLSIRECYNTGAIHGSTKSAALCASTNSQFTFKNCYNSGSVTGVKNKEHFYHVYDFHLGCSISNCYDINGSQGDGVRQISSDMVTSGALCKLLNSTDTLFSQVVGTDAYPVPGTAGLSGIYDMHISTADELVAFADNVNGGNSYASFTVYLDDDIDLSGISFPVIGRWRNKPFRGTFDGQGHRIRNMHLNFDEEGIGFFGCVAGVCTIKNLIIDSSCSVTSTGHQAIAGLVGKSEEYDSFNTITIENCGNEATVKGGVNTAGIIGKVFSNTNTQLNINNCYNTGAISGSKESATICGWAYKNISISNCYNSGTLSGKAGSDYLFRYNHDGNLKVSNCYDVNGTQAGVKKVGYSQITSGEVCGMLNKTNTVFSQTLPTQTYPVPGTDGLTGVTNLVISTPEELVAFADSVNNGLKDYAGSFVYLADDIDLSGITDFMGIGSNDGSKTFMGIFNGLGHRIKNWHVTYHNMGYGNGFFRRVSGSNCVIKNLIIDKSCSITSTGENSGIAGIVGYVTSTSGSICNVTIENCGNEAAITGYDNAAGILGGVYNNVSTNLAITNCYNTGAIKGNQHSATLCAIANCNHIFTNCYNIGSLAGVRDDDYFYRTEKGSSSVINCFDINASGSGVSWINSDMVSSGELCNLLNMNGNVFSQALGTDAYPIIGTKGLTNCSTMHIGTADELVSFATNVNNGNTYGGKIVCLDNDIDLSGKSFPVIGRFYSHPFRGTFDGQGHRIRNMTLNYSEGGIALFGVAAGVCTIKNLIIDSSCSVTTTKGAGIAGLVGEARGYNSDNFITIENCGNEATVTGKENTAGILGVVYSDTNTQLNITNCYNTGAINGSKESATICGYAHKNYSIKNCYNSGTLKGVDGSNVLYRYGSGGTASASNNYDVNGSQTGVTKITAAQVQSGYLCNKLNAIDTIYTQDLAKDSNPILVFDSSKDGTSGLHYSRTVKSQWGAICLPFAIGEGDGYELYQLGELTDNVINLSRTETLDAGTPGIIRCNTPQGTIDIAATGNTFAAAPVTEFTQDGLTIRGTFSSLNISNLSGYKLMNSYLKYWNGNNAVCEPYNAYFTSDMTAGPRIILFSTGTIVTIHNASELNTIANAVNQGNDLSGVTLQLANDIDYNTPELIAGFAPIGTEANPYRGLFDGRGYRIKNLTFECDTAQVGLFGTVSGEATLIKNVIIDSSCSFTTKGTYAGIAGLMGCVQSTPRMTCNLFIYNCGNEADIKGYGDVAGILGGVYANDSTYLEIVNSYNTGAISGTKNSATLCGYARKNYTFTNCYNSGKLTGVDGTKYFYRNATGGTSSVTNCYDVTGTQTGVTKIAPDDVRFGNLCQKLNLNGNVFTQDLENDSHPVPGNNGLCYTRSMSNQWGTIVLPFDVDISDTTYCKFYQLAAVTDSLLTLKQLEGSLSAGTPALVCMLDTMTYKKTGMYELSLIPANTNVSTTIYNADPVDALTLTGTYSTLADKTQIYYIYDNKFWYADDPIGVPPFRAYIDGTIDGIKRLAIHSKRSSIDGIVYYENDNENEDKVIYNLAGQRVNAPKKGQINIIGGKKVLVK